MEDRNIKLKYFHGNSYHYYYFNNKNTADNSNTYKNNITCYLCGQKGHVSTFCKNKNEDKYSKRNFMIQTGLDSEISRAKIIIHYRG